MENEKYDSALRYTSIINAGVVWTLAYEWLFYFSLPLISILVIKNRATIVYILLSIIFVVIFITIIASD